VLELFTRQLSDARSLTPEQSRVAVEHLIDESNSPLLKADFLIELARKGETAEEIASFARALLEHSIQPPIDPVWRRSTTILDVCGTGGDRLNTFNISTTVALICAAAGVPVAKHGNRAITSQAGSADVLEALGIPIDLAPAAAAKSLKERNFAFFFAPRYHPAFKQIASARKICAERGQRTIFNFLGPLLNPVRPTAQLVGVPRPELCEPIARVLQLIGGARGMAVCGQVDGPDSAATRWLDELSTLGENRVAEFYQERAFTASNLSLDPFPLQPAVLDDLLGGTREANAEIVRRILHGDERGPKRDAVLLNAAAALFVAGRSRTLADGWELASQVIDSGQAQAKLKQLAG
jgi:anthranilate phosphoribosyltransferase